MRGEERSPQGGSRRESVNCRAGHKILRGSLRGCRSPRLSAASYKTVPFYHASFSCLFPPSVPILSSPLQPLASPVTQPVPPAPRHPREGMQNRRSFKSAGEPGLDADPQWPSPSSHSAASRPGEWVLPGERGARWEAPNGLWGPSHHGKIAVRERADGSRGLNNGGLALSYTPSNKLRSHSLGPLCARCWVFSSC